MSISGLTHAASAPALLRFAFRVATHAQGWLPAGWLAFTGRESNPLDHCERFQIMRSSSSPVLLTLLKLIWYAVAGLLRSRAALQTEVLVLRHQLNVRRAPKRVAVRNIDRLVFAGLYRLAPEVLEAKSSSLRPSSDGIAPASVPGGAEIKTARRSTKDT